MTLLARLFVLVLLAVLPAVGIQAYGVFQFRAEREEEVAAQAERLLHLVEGEQARIVDGARLMVTSIAESAALRAGDFGRCREHLARLTRLAPEYRSLAVVGRDGTVLCSGAADAPARLPTSLPHIRRAMEEGHFVVGEWTPGASDPGAKDKTQGPESTPATGTLPFAIPFRNEAGEIAGVVTLGLDLPWLSANFAARPLPENASLLVTDRNGNILVKLPNGIAQRGERVPPAYLELVGDERGGVATMPGLDGVTRVLAYSSARRGVRDLFISVGLDHTTAIGNIDRSTRHGLLLTLAGLLVAIAAAWIGGTLFIRRPVAVLIRAAQTWGEGDSTARAGLADRTSEIGQLGSAFDAMAGTLEARERALRSSEEHLRAVLDALPAFIGVLAPTGEVLQVNRAAIEAAGLPADQILGRPFHETSWWSFDSAGREQLRAAVARAAHGERSRFDAAIRLAGDRQIIVDVALTPMLDAAGRVTHLIVSATDITERKSTEEALRVTNERFRTALRNSGVAVFNQDRDLRYTWMHNPALGYTAERVVGKTDHEVFEDHGDADSVTAIKRRVLLTGEGVRDEVRIRQDGCDHFYDLTVDPLRGPDGSIVGVTCAAVDVTGRKQAEADLRRAREAAETAAAGKSKFLAVASHDLRQPVQSLYLFAAALGDRLQGHPGLPLLDNMRQSLDTLKGLLDGLLDMSRLESGKIAVTKTDVRMGQVLGRLVAEYAPRAAQKGLMLRAVPTRAWVRTDPAHLERILRNLIENALRYTRKGRILIGCRRTKGGLRVEVWDSGIGIPADRLDEIFEEFTQLNTNGDRGLGLGLAIVKRLSKLLGHRVGVRSTEGRGSVFSVELPRVAAEKTRAAAVELRQVANDCVNKGMVLVIDDEAIILLGLKAMLEGWGYSVLTARSGDQALERLRADGRRPQVVLADYQLQQGRTGPEALAAVQGLVGTDVPGIILTGDTAPERLDEAQRKGFRILHKPVFPNDLRKLMASAGAA
ncbi:PAS domain-containing protein [Azospirillum canadense]|uniref:PAS domain-containing protein n=1 Tax=Azospirillum canadense TaxID=403962 RepID=UPI002227CA8D|nr:PAS domain-containing protein [Azospirillum canadense]MCW2235748.1 PAS domain S-box-containing protein [Azospirillum canadense]